MNWQSLLQHRWTHLSQSTRGWISHMLFGCMHTTFAHKYAQRRTHTNSSKHPANTASLYFLFKLSECVCLKQKGWWVLVVCVCVSVFGQAAAVKMLLNRVSTGRHCRHRNVLSHLLLLGIFTTVKHTLSDSTLTTCDPAQL